VDNDETQVAMFDGGYVTPGELFRDKQFAFSFIKQ
jgi:hypothetical protein